VSPRTASRLQIIAAALLFSTGGAAIKAASLTSWQVASFRSGVAAATVLLLVPAARRGWTWHVLPVGVAYAATMVLFVLANKLTTSANTIFLQSTAPLYILLLSPFLLRERIRRGDVAFMAVVGAGLLMFLLGANQPLATAPDPGRGNVLALLSGLAWALTVIGLRWMGGRGEGSAIPTVVAGNAIAFLVCLAPALPVGHATTADWLVIGYLGVFQIAVAYLFVSAGIRHVPALEASTLLLVEPALNPVWAWLVHGERPGTWAICGGVLIMAATAAKTWWDARNAPRASDTPAPAPP
jgi:drug/metabolite transporter (DMT)-like permease